MIDLIRFDYTGDFRFGFDRFIVFNEDTRDNIQGCVIKVNSPKELRIRLKHADGFIGVMSEKAEVNRYAVMRKKVDVILDFPERKLDYITFKLAKEKDVLIEVSLRNLFLFEKKKMTKFIHELRTIFRVINKFDTPFILTSGAENFYEMRTKDQIYDLFSFLGADIKRAEYWAERLYRRLFDEKYIMDGVELV